MSNSNHFQIIAETAFTHEGNLEYLLNQVRLAAKADADYVKFQVLVDPENYLVRSSEQIQALRGLTFGKDEWLKVISFARELGLKVLALPLTMQSLNFLSEHQALIDAFEIHSVNFMELSLLDLFAKMKKTTVLLGIGGRYSHEISFVLSKLKKHETVLMFGFQSFPTDKNKLNLGKIKTCSETYDVPIGYADHSGFDTDDFVELSKYAYMLGCSYFELHIINRKGSKRIDHNSAHNKNDFLWLRSELEQLNSILGNYVVDALNEKEMRYRSREKRIVAIKELAPGRTLTIDDIEFKVSNSDLANSINVLDNLIGRRLKRTKKEQELFYEDDFHA